MSKLGRKVISLQQLAELVEKRKAVWVPLSPNFRGPRPAAFMIQQQGSFLLRLFRLGMYVYQKKRPFANGTNLELKI